MKMDNTLSTMTLVLVMLKLTDTIDWNWWWVFSPILIPSGVALLLYIIVIWSMIIEDLIVKLKKYIKNEK